MTDSDGKNLSKGKEALSFGHLRRRREKETNGGAFLRAFSFSFSWGKRRKWLRFSRNVRPSTPVSPILAMCWVKTSAFFKGGEAGKRKETLDEKWTSLFSFFVRHFLRETAFVRTLYLLSSQSLGLNWPIFHTLSAHTPFSPAWRDVPFSIFPHLQKGMMGVSWLKIGSEQFFPSSNFCSIRTSEASHLLPEFLLFLSRIARRKFEMPPSVFHEMLSTPPSVSHCFSALLSLSFYYFPIFARREILKWRKNKRERERGSLLFKLFFFNFPFAIDTQKIAWLRLQFHEKETFFLPIFSWDNSAQCSFPAKKNVGSPS